MKKYIYFIFFLFCNQINSQEFFLNLGKNISTYDYQNHNEAYKNLEFRDGEGNSYEIGYYTNLNGSSFYYAIGISLNEFNAEASFATNDFKWKTKYIGIINKLFYNLNSKKPLYCFGLDLINFFSLGINTATLVEGSQFINNYYFDLTKEEDFSGILIQPSIGLNTQLTVTRNLKFVLEYHFSKSLNLLNKSDEKLSFNNHQLQLGIQLYFDR